MRYRTRYVNNICEVRHTNPALTAYFNLTSRASCFRQWVSVAVGIRWWRHMRSERFLARLALLFAAGLAPFSSAHASAVLDDNTNLMQGAQSFAYSFTVTTPGTLTISLTDIPWLDKISDFQFSLTSTNHLVGPTMDPGVESFQINSGTYCGLLFGDADGKYKLGLFNLEITFNPATQVPLPASLVLMLSGLGLVFARQRRRRVCSPAE